MSGFHLNGRPCEATKRACPLGETGEHFEGTAEEFAVWLVERDLTDDDERTYNNDEDFRSAVEMWMTGGAVDHLAEAERVGLEDAIIESGFYGDFEQVQENYLAGLMTAESLTPELAEGVPDAEKRAVAVAAQDALREKWSSQMLTLHQEGYRVTVTSAERYGSDVLLIGWLTDEGGVARGDLDIMVSASRVPTLSRMVGGAS